MGLMCVEMDVGRNIGSPPSRVASDRLCAELAARGCDGNQRLALDTGFFCRIRYRRFSFELSHDVVHGHHNDEVDDGCLQQERDHGVEKDAVVDLAAIHVEDERREVRLANKGCDDRGKDVRYK
jgi:hypothetical protein